MSANGVERDIDAIQLDRWGAVRRADGVVPWVVMDPSGDSVDPIRVFLRDFVARDNRAGSVRSYAYGLLRWWRFLRAVDVPWDRATSAEARDFVLWLQRTTKTRGAVRPAATATAGTINPITRKQHLDDRFKSRTIRHSNSVVRSFYAFWIERGEGPLVNPMPLQRTGHRPNAHHNPLKPFKAEGRLRFNPKVPKARPRAMPDERWNDLFAALKSNRDRAILAFAVSTAARASELLGVLGGDLDWGDQLIRVKRKGSGAQQWLPASPDAFVWLRLYFADAGAPGLDEPVWRTLRKRDRGSGRRFQPLDYDALRAVLRRANKLLGANWSFHDLRHTCALRMLRDERLSLRDIQIILGHAHLSTTQIYLEMDDTEVIARVREHLAEVDGLPAKEPPTPAGYDADALAVLFGTAR